MGFGVLACWPATGIDCEHPQPYTPNLDDERNALMVPMITVTMRTITTTRVMKMMMMATKMMT